jgi:sulfatase maturation enzyme AslB (radical SAM superfamily)
MEEIQVKPSACAKCQWFSVCKAGCSQHRFMVSHKFDSRNYFCEANRRIIEHVNTKVDSIFEKAKELAE